MSKLCDICGSGDANVMFWLHGSGAEAYRVTQDSPKDLCLDCTRDVLEATSQLCGEPRQHRPEKQDPLERFRAAQRVWKDVPKARRESLVLEALGEDGLLVRECVPRLNALLDTPEFPSDEF